MSLVGGSWGDTTVDSSGDVGRYTSIVADSNRHVYISYYDATNGNLKYATDVTGFWATTPLDTSGDVGKYTSLAVDNEDGLHISYYDATNGDLKYVTTTTNTPVFTTVDSSGDVGKYTSITCGRSLVYIAYYNDINKRAKVATMNGLFPCSNTACYVTSKPSSGNWFVDKDTSGKWFTPGGTTAAAVPADQSANTFCEGIAANYYGTAGAANSAHATVTSCGSGHSSDAGSDAVQDCYKASAAVNHFAKQGQSNKYFRARRELPPLPHQGHYR